MALELSGSARPRPLRIAYLVQDGEHSDFALDGIFADCYDRWGGRFSLIAPCVDGRVLPTYWPWLEAFDPDIVYSYVPLCRDDILQVHERLSPAEYIFHKHHGEPTLDLFSFKPRYDFAPLSSLSTIFRQARFGPGIGMAGGPVHIIDAWSGEGRNTEADLLAVLDGKAILCEVKSSWQVTRTKDIQKLVTQALGLRPDRAILAVMENGAGPKDEIVKAKQELAAAGIEFEVMTPSQGDFRDDPHLPHDSDQR